VRHWIGRTFGRLMMIRISIPKIEQIERKQRQPVDWYVFQVNDDEVVIEFLDNDDIIFEVGMPHQKADKLAWDILAVKVTTQSSQAGTDTAGG